KGHHDDVEFQGCQWFERFDQGSLVEFLQYASVSIHPLCCFNDCFFGNERFWSALVLIIDRGARLMGDGKHITKSLGGDHPDAGAISGNDRVGCNCTAVDEPGELFGGATNTFKSAFNAC